MQLVTLILGALEIDLKVSRYSVIFECEYHVILKNSFVKIGINTLNIFLLKIGRVMVMCTDRAMSRQIVT